MKLKKIAEEYDVSEELLLEFFKYGIFDEITDLCTDIEKDIVRHQLSFCLCLYTIGLDLPTIKVFMQLKHCGQKGTQARIKILNDHRKKVLKDLHDTKELIDCIDEIIKEIEQNKI